MSIDGLSDTTKSEFERLRSRHTIPAKYALIGGGMAGLLSLIGITADELVIDLHVLETQIQSLSFYVGPALSAFVGGIVGFRYGKHVQSEKELYARQLRDNLALEELRLIMEHSPESVVITDARGIITYVNRTFEQVTGYTKKDAIGKNPRILRSRDNYQFLEPQSSEFYADLWATILSGKSWNGLFENIKKDGTHYVESASINPVHNSLGEIKRRYYSKITN